MLDSTSAGSTDAGTASTRKMKMLRSEIQNSTSWRTEHPVLTEPVEVHQHLVPGLEHLVAGVGRVGAREVERHHAYVVVDADEGAAGAGGLPLEEADDEREQQRAGEEEEEVR